MEIEKKFLVSYIPKNIDSYPKKEISQSYIALTPTIRIRKSNDDYILTIKSKGDIQREEYELNISQYEYDHLKQKCETPEVTKTRYIIPIHNNLNAELDIYHNHLEGLITVEVEFDTIDICETFVPPDWFSKDITFDNRYKNTSLSINGLPKD